MSTLVNTPGTAETPGRDAIVHGLVEIGHYGIAIVDDAALAAYFADGFVFHGPDGHADLDDLKAFWTAMRAAFTGFAVERGHVLVDGRWVAAQTIMSGTFEHEFTASPVGPVPPTGRPFTLHLQNIFRFDGDGRLAEEWCQYDNLLLLDELGVSRR